ncbi:hypothetical protein [Moritella marina]|nr:hypothetical protein [Moritella marina]
MMSFKKVLLASIIASTLVGCDSSSPDSVIAPAPVTLTIPTEMQAQDVSGCDNEYMVTHSIEMRDDLELPVNVAEVRSVCNPELFVEYDVAEVDKPMVHINWAKEVFSEDGDLIMYQGGHAKPSSSAAHDKLAAERGYRGYYLTLDELGGYINANEVTDITYFSSGNYHHTFTSGLDKQSYTIIDNTIDTVVVSAAMFVDPTKVDEHDWNEFWYECTGTVTSIGSNETMGCLVHKAGAPKYQFQTITVDMNNFPKPTKFKEDYAHATQMYVEKAFTDNGIMIE